MLAHTCEFLVLALRSVEALLCVDILLPKHLHISYVKCGPSISKLLRLKKMRLQ
jgi:hypothetical protein